MGYNNILVHLTMLRDAVRTDAYRKAIKRIVKRGDRVVDFGCGTGILSFFASRCGAREVHAIDESKIIRVAAKLARRNGFQNIVFYHQSVERFQLNDKADVLISEWMGSFVFLEWMLKPLVHLRDRVLKEGGVLIPERVMLKIGFIVDNVPFDYLRFFDSRPYGLDFTTVSDWPFSKIKLMHLNEEQILPSVVEIDTIDMSVCSGTPNEMSGTIRADRKAKIHGLCGWFQATLCEGVIIETGPFDPRTHWGQVVFPLNRPIHVDTGDMIKASVLPFRKPGEKQTHWQWSVTNGSECIKMDNFVHRIWLSRDLPDGRLA